ncbi:MAG TPA: hypothetical protein GX519_03580 [Thermoanaerobacterales bacterium]|nr:hypothetical protein [Thermoanaerobacterales bacterium]
MPGSNLGARRGSIKLSERRTFIRLFTYTAWRIYAINPWVLGRNPNPFLI